MGGEGEQHEGNGCIILVRERLQFAVYMYILTVDKHPCL